MSDTKPTKPTSPIKKIHPVPPPQKINPNFPGRKQQTFRKTGRGR